MKSKFKDGLFEHAYLIKPDIYNLIVPFCMDKTIGAVSLPLVKEGEDYPEKYKQVWGYKLKKVDGSHIVEINGRLMLGKGIIKTPDKWKIRFTRCDNKRLYLIINWLEKLQKEAIKDVR